MPEYRVGKIGVRDEFSNTIFDRFSMALANVKEGDVKASLRSIFRPTTLSPIERRKIYTDFGGGPVVKALVEASTNPFVIIGLILSLKYPIHKIRNLFAYSAEAGGIAKGLSPIAKFLSTPETIFRGHPKVSKLLTRIINAVGSKKTFYGTEFSKGYDKFYKAMGRLPTKEENFLASMMSEANHTAGGYVSRITAAQLRDKGLGNFAGRTLIKANAIPVKLRRALETLGGEQRKALNIIKKHYDGLPVHARKEVDEIMNRSGGLSTVSCKFLDDYFPHYVTKQRALVSDIPVTREVYSDITAGAAHPVAKSEMLRRNAAVPSISQLEQINPKYVDQGFLDAIRRRVASSEDLARTQMLGVLESPMETRQLRERLTSTMVEQFGVSQRVAGDTAARVVAARDHIGMDAARKLMSQKASIFGRIPEYNIANEEVITRYFNQYAVQEAWTIIPPNETMSYGKQLVQEAQGLEGIRRTILQDEYIPMARGMKTFQQAASSQSYNEVKLRLLETLENPTLRKFLSGLPGGQGVVNFMEKNLSTSSVTTEGDIFRNLTKLTLHGAMGLNPSPALKNLTQPWITTANLYGPKVTLKGYGQTLKELPKFFSEVQRHVRGGMKWPQALEAAERTVWPQFVEQGLPGYSMFGELSQSNNPQWVGGFKAAIEKGSNLSMGFFSATEKFNRLITFNSGLIKAASEGVGGLEAAELAATGVRMTQFAGGPLGVPHGTIHWPKLLRQFTQFPLRMLDFLYSSVRFGSEKTGGMDFGTIGRTMATSGSAYSMGRQLLGVDLSNALITGAVPAPLWEGSPFYPLPIVPPALTILGGLGHAAMTGKTEQLGGQLATLVPGGVAARRAYRSFHPKFADYENPNEDGTINTFDRKGNLIKSYTPSQMVMRSMGIRLMDEETEREFVDYIVKQRDVLREYRNDYLQSILTNDLEKSKQIQAEYMKRYPQLGPLQVKKSDIKALQRRRELTRVQRVIEGMPSAARPLFSGMNMMLQNENTERLVTSGISF